MDVGNILSGTLSKHSASCGGGVRGVPVWEARKLPPRGLIPTPEQAGCCRDGRVGDHHHTPQTTKEDVVEKKMRKAWVLLVAASMAWGLFASALPDS